MPPWHPTLPRLWERVRGMKKKIGVFLLALPFIALLAAPAIAAIQHGDWQSVLMGYGIAAAIVGCVVGGVYLIG